MQFSLSEPGMKNVLGVRDELEVGRVAYQRGTGKLSKLQSEGGHGMQYVLHMRGPVWKKLRKEDCVGYLAVGKRMIARTVLEACLYANLIGVEVFRVPAISSGIFAESEEEQEVICEYFSGLVL